MLTGFSKRKLGYGCYRISYNKPNQINSWYEYTLTDMPLFDAVFNAENPKKSDIFKLRHLVLIKGTLKHI